MSRRGGGRRRGPQTGEVCSLVPAVFIAFELPVEHAKDASRVAPLS